MTGIDISHHQTAVPDGDWEFVVVKATEGVDFVDPMFLSHWKVAARFPRRGVFHYARPGDGHDGHEQAAFFADTAMARGFQPDVDIWQLDIEGEKNEGVPAALWQRFIDAFMETALAQLGRVGFLYIGWPFYQGIFDKTDLKRLGEHNWWLPSYGANDGAVHPFDDDVPTEFVVIHQFTSVTPDGAKFDQNRVVDTNKWAALTGSAARMSAHPGEDEHMRLIPRRAVAHPAFEGRIGYIKFDVAKKTLVSFNGIDFDRRQDPKVWKFTQGFGLVSAQLLLPVSSELSYGETPDGTAVVITDDHDGGTFALPYKQLAPQ
jgi:GH25 family lysozyme M1 (1,4-beta-N-acetylmuramidase)